MANCRICGSPLAHFKNPDRLICPTPERHATQGQQRQRIERAMQGARARKGKPSPGSGNRRGKK